MSVTNKAKEIFFEALERGSQAELQEFLDEACAGDQEVRRHVE